jgi:hypothetical protein
MLASPGRHTGPRVVRRNAVVVSVTFSNSVPKSSVHQTTYIWQNTPLRLASFVVLTAVAMKYVCSWQWYRAMRRIGTQNVLPPPSGWSYFPLKQESTGNYFRCTFDDKTCGCTEWPTNRIDVFYSFCPYFIWVYLPQNWKEKDLARTLQPEVLTP